MSRFVAVMLILISSVMLSGCGPTEKKEGSEWSHSELMDHLHREGLAFTAKETGFGGNYGPAMYFQFSGDKEVYVQVRKSAQEAKDAASPKGGEAFSWGRFYFLGEPKELQIIKEKLTY